MTAGTIRPPFDRFLDTAEVLARTRSEDEGDIIREVFREVASMLDNGLALDGLDEHDTEAAVVLLCQDLTASDPGAAVRARSQAVHAVASDLHDPAAVGGALLVAASILRI